VPWRFTSFEEEYAALRQGVGLLDYSTQALIEVRGPDRAVFLHNLLTNDIKTLAPGRSCRAALLNASAKLISDLFVLAEDQAHWLVCDLSRAVVVAETLNRYLFAEQVTLVNHERRWAVLALQGPRTIEALTEVFGGVVALPQPGDHVRRMLGDLPVWVVRQSLAGGLGAWCLIDADAAQAAWTLFAQRGGRIGLRLVGWEALNAARIEAGIPWFGIDMDESNLLPETGLERTAVSDTKGCYLGQEIVARLATYGSASRKLMGVVFEGADQAQAGDEIRCRGEDVGRITSAGYSPALGRAVALGYLKRGAYEAGTAVDVLRGAARLRAAVAATPLARTG